MADIFISEKSPADSITVLQHFSKEEKERIADSHSTMVEATEVSSQLLEAAAIFDDFNNICESNECDHQCLRLRVDVKAKRPSYFESLSQTLQRMALCYVEAMVPNWNTGAITADNLGLYLEYMYLQVKKTADAELETMAESLVTILQPSPVPVKAEEEVKPAQIRVHNVENTQTPELNVMTNASESADSCDSLVSVEEKSEPVSELSNSANNSSRLSSTHLALSVAVHQQLWNHGPGFGIVPLDGCRKRAAVGAENTGGAKKYKAMSRNEECPSKATRGRGCGRLLVTAASIEGVSSVNDVSAGGSLEGKPKVVSRRRRGKYVVADTAPAGAENNEMLGAGRNMWCAGSDGEESSKKRVLIPKGVYRTKRGFRVQLNITSSVVKKFSRNTKTLDHAVWLYEIAVLISDAPTSLNSMLTLGNYSAIVSHGYCKDVCEYHKLLLWQIEKCFGDKVINSQERDTAVKIYEVLQL